MTLAFRVGKRWNSPGSRGMRQLHLRKHRFPGPQSRASQGVGMNRSAWVRKFAAMTALVCLALAVNAAAQIPAGTGVKVRLGSTISSGSAQAGQAFVGTLASDVVVGGKTVAKAGNPVKGKVTSAKSSGRLHAPG